MHELHMCRIKGKGLGAVGFSSMGMDLGEDGRVEEELE